MRICRASAARRSASLESMPRRRAASATARYIAPVSRKVYPRRSATSAPIVLFPAPAGPSIAIVRGVTATLVVGPHFVSQLWSTGATVAVAPARSAGSILVMDAPRFLPRLGHLARELAAPPARL